MQAEPLDFSSWNGVHALSPHSDDAGFSCALLLRKSAVAGLPVTLQTVFSHSGYAYGDPDADIAAVNAERLAEDRAFARLLGDCCRMQRDNFPEAYLRKGGFDQILSGRYDAEDQALMPQLLEALAGCYDPAGLLLAPLGLGNHVDHLLVRDVALAYARHLKSDLWLYEDLPYADKSGMEEIANMLRLLGDSLGFQAVRVLVGAEDAVAFKQSAANCYPSQLLGDALSRITARTDEVRGEAYWKLAWTR